MINTQNTIKQVNNYSLFTECLNIPPIPVTPGGRLRLVHRRLRAAHSIVAFRQLIWHQRTTQRL